MAGFLLLADDYYVHNSTYIKYVKYCYTVYCQYIEVVLLFADIMLTKRQKQNATKEVQRHENDTGSAESQVAILSKRIDELTKHLKKNKKDNHSRRGLLQMVADRRKHLKYLEKNDKKSYSALIKKLNLKK